MPQKIRCTRCRMRTENWKPSIGFIAPGVYREERLCAECQRNRAAVVKAARAAYTNHIEAARSTIAGRARLALRSFLVRVLALVSSMLRKVTP